MKPYLALIKIDLKLAYRQPVVIFFTYLFPLLFFFGFAELLRVKQGGTISYVVSMVLVLGILGNGLFGAGMRTVQERDNNILRRFRVAPITPTPLLVASTFTGWLIYMPAVLLILLLAHLYLRDAGSRQHDVAAGSRLVGRDVIPSYRVDCGVGRQLDAREQYLHQSALPSDALAERSDFPDHTPARSRAVYRAVCTCVVSGERFPRDFSCAASLFGTFGLPRPP